MTKSIGVDALPTARTTVGRIITQVGTTAKRDLISDTLTGARYTGAYGTTSVAVFAITVVITRLETDAFHADSA